jgi:hypothetical protein
MASFLSEQIARSASPCSTARPKSPTVCAPDTSTVLTQGAFRLSGIRPVGTLAQAFKLSAEAIRKPLVRALDLIDRTFCLLLLGADGLGFVGHGIEGARGDALLPDFGHGTVGAGLLVAVGGPEQGEGGKDDGPGFDLPREGAEKSEGGGHENILRSAAALSKTTNT